MPDIKDLTGSRKIPVDWRGCLTRDGGYSA